jgi:hypothetical protein
MTTGKLVSEARLPENTKGGQVYTCVSADGKRVFYVLNSAAVYTQPKPTFEAVVEDLATGKRVHSVIKGWAREPFEDVGGKRFGVTRYPGVEPSALVHIDASTGKQVETFSPLGASNKSALICAGGHRAWAAVGEQLVAYDAPHDKPVDTFGHKEETVVAWSAAGRVTCTMRDGR